MNPSKLFPGIFRLTLLIILVVGCVPATGESSDTDTPTPHRSPQAYTSLPPIATHTPVQPDITHSPLDPTVTEPQAPRPTEHRIGVRLVGGMGEFYDRVSGEKFIPRGNNYIRLSDQRSPSGETILYHSTFNLRLYDPDRAEDALQRMQADGYNIVRVFLNGCCIEASLGDPDGGLSRAYIQNLVDFLRRAKAHDIYVILTTDDPPAVGGYIEILDTTWSEDFGGNSAYFLRTGGVCAEVKFWGDLIRALIHGGAPLDSIFAYALRNEQFFLTDLPPFSLGSGVVETANGKSYDMASEEQKNLMMDEGLVYWIDTVRGEILKLDPTALVTMGFFPPDEPNPWPSVPRKVRTSAALWESGVDFLDFHPYPGGYNLDKLVENYGMSGLDEKPVIMGEFGAAHSTYASETQTARALHDWQVESCLYGFDGWLLWTWDSDEQTDFYNALAGDGLINQVLSPLERSDPCRAGEFEFSEVNLALGVPAIASRALPDQPPGGAVDGSINRWWGAGAFAPQWIQIDLGELTSIGSIRLVVTQTPGGNTRHLIWVGPSTDLLYLLHTFEGYTYDDQVLEFKPDSPVEGVRYIRIMTKESPSWVGWKEIEVLAP